MHFKTGFLLGVFYGNIGCTISLDFYPYLWMSCSVGCHPTRMGLTASARAFKSQFWHPAAYYRTIIGTQRKTREGSITLQTKSTLQNTFCNRSLLLAVWIKCGVPIWNLVKHEEKQKVREKRKARAGKAKGGQEEEWPALVASIL